MGRLTGIQMLVKSLSKSKWIELGKTKSTMVSSNLLTH